MVWYHQPILYFYVFCGWTSWNTFWVLNNRLPHFQDFEWQNIFRISLSNEHIISLNWMTFAGLLRQLILSLLISFSIYLDFLLFVAFSEWVSVHTALRPPRRGMRKFRGRYIPLYHYRKVYQTYTCFGKEKFLFFFIPLSW